MTGIDVDPEQIRLARDAAGNRVDVRFLVGDATHLPFDDAEFDVVATNKTTHHIPEWSKRQGAWRATKAYGGGQHHDA